MQATVLGKMHREPLSGCAALAAFSATWPAQPHCRDAVGSGIIILLPPSLRILFSVPASTELSK
jgi:hypothetical protein